MPKNQSPRPEPPGLAITQNRFAKFWGELNPFVWIYFFLSSLELRPKLWITTTWFDGTLEQNHAALLAFQYTNNEQSRLLQYYLPEALVRLFGVSVVHAYIVQRWFFVGLAFVLFHLYLRQWFSKVASFAAVCLLAAILPFSFTNELQESSCLLMATYVATLWIIRDCPEWAIAMALMVGALNNETSLALALVFFADRFRGWHPQSLWKTIWQTVAVSAPALIYTALIRYITRDRPHLGGAFHLYENLARIWGDLHINIIDYPGSLYLSIFFIFNLLWIFAFLRLGDKPRFIRATLVLIPAFIVAHLVTGVIQEVRQMIPLGFVVIPAAMFWIFDEEVTPMRAKPNIVKN